MSGQEMKLAEQGPTPLRPYAQRYFRFDDLVDADGFHIKAYTISEGGDELPRPLIDTAVRFTAEQLPALAGAEGDHYDVGFAVLHQGEQATWLLLHWWAHGDICCQRLAASIHGADAAQAVFEYVDHRPFHACVWEGRVISFEHQAWMANALTADPNIPGYLEATLQDGWY